MIGDIGRSWLPLARLVRQVEAELLTPVTASLFLTPPGGRGFPTHLDVYDTTILQITGEKEWRIYRPRVPLPLRSQSWSIDPADPGNSIDAKLRPGDLLNMPRDFVHETSTGDTASMHLTLIALPYRWCDQLHDLVAEMAERDGGLRRHVLLAARRRLAAGDATGRIPDSATRS